MSILFFEKALKTLKKANQVRRLKLAQEAGYTTVEAYQLFLETKIKEEPIRLEPVEAIVTEKPKSKKKPKPTPELVEEPAKVLTDLVIAFDTTGSMNAYLSAVKTHVKELIPSLFSQNPNLKISIVAFGDYCDMVNETTFGKAYQVIELTNNSNQLISFVSGAKSTSGGDTDEFYELVIKKITEETAWREGSNKSVLLIADYGPHPIGYSATNSVGNYVVRNAQIDWREEAKKAASLGIKFDTLRILANQRWYKELSEITGGVCLDFKTSHKTSQLVEATVLARGGEATRGAFMAKSMAVEASSDTEMKAVYSMYKTIIK